MTFRVVAISIALGLATFPAAARDVLGSGYVNGKVVRLFDDGTWEYDQGSASDACNFVDSVVQLCDPDLIWKRSSGPNFGFDAIYFNTRDDNLFAAIGSQPYGHKNGNSIDGVIQHFIKGAAEIDGLAPEEIPVHNVAETRVAGIPATQFTIGFPQGGLRQINMYSIVIERDVSVYALTWSVGDAPTDRMSTAHADFTSKLDIDPAKADK